MLLDRTSPGRRFVCALIAGTVLPLTAVAQSTARPPASADSLVTLDLVLNDKVRVLQDTDVERQGATTVKLSRVPRPAIAVNEVFIAGGEAFRAKGPDEKDPFIVHVMAPTVRDVFSKAVVEFADASAIDKPSDSGLVMLKTVAAPRPHRDDVCDAGVIGRLLTTGALRCRFRMAPLVHQWPKADVDLGRLMRFGSEPAIEVALRGHARYLPATSVADVAGTTWFKFVHRLTGPSPVVGSAIEVGDKVFKPLPLAQVGPLTIALAFGGKFGIEGHWPNVQPLDLRSTWRYEIEFVAALDRRKDVRNRFERPEFEWLAATGASSRSTWTLAPSVSGGAMLQLRLLKSVLLLADVGLDAKLELPLKVQRARGAGPRQPPCVDLEVKFATALKVSVLPELGAFSHEVKLGEWPLVDPVALQKCESASAPTRRPPQASAAGS